jgi:Family of unknown function (DUF6599)
VTSRFAAAALLLVASSAVAAPGWKRSGKAEIYDRATIWQAINGAAPLFISYGFRTMREQTYRASGKREVAAQVYDQATPLGAFGVFSRERPPGAAEVGASGAFATGGHCLAYKGRYYIKIVTSAGALKRAECAWLLARVAAPLAGADKLPPQLALLPAQGRVVGSLGYTRRAYLGTRRLRDCLHASYTREAGKPYTLFIMLPGPGEDAAAAWRRLAKHWKPRTVGGLKLLVATIPYRGKVALARRADTLIGAAGVGDLKATAAQLRRFPAVK